MIAIDRFTFPSMKQTINEQALALVEKKLPALKGSLTPQDAATATGITVGEAQDALSRLMELYVTRVSADDNGNILFIFEQPLRRRGTKTAAEKWAETKEKVWRGFKLFFKIWIGLMVIVYFIVMAVLLIALVFAQKASDNDDDDRSSGMLAGLFRVIAEGLRFAFWTHAYSSNHYAYDEHGYRYREVDTPRSASGKGKSFIIAIYDLALGQERADADPLENEKEVAAFLRAEKGVLTPAEILALSGGTMADAEERMADYLVRFNGDPTITEEGVVVGEFDAFISGAAAKAEGKIIPFWDEFEPPYEHSGNSAGRNAIIIAMVAFTAIMGAALLAGGLDRLAIASPFFRTGLAHFLLGWLPLLFSIIYAGVSLVRLPIVKKKEAERLERNRKKKVIRAIFQGKLWSATADQIYFTMMSMGEKDIKRTDLPAILESLAPELQCDVDLDDQGEPVYNFSRVGREIEAAEKLRGEG
jgi:hypothetical protein